MMRTVAVLLAVMVLAGCSTAPRAADELTFLGQRQLPRGEVFNDTVVGGLSGISYDSGAHRYYVISDDKLEHGPVRFYTVDISLRDNGFDAVNITAMTPLLDTDGRPFAGTSAPDAEGIAFDSRRKQLYWSSEGGRPTGDRTPVTPQPWVRIAGLDGSYRGQFALPPDYVIAPGPGTGIRPNRGPEALSLAPNGRYLFAGLEEGLYGDDPQLTRVVKLDVESQQVVAQYRYPLDAPQGGVPFGLSDFIALGDAEFLTVERGGPPTSVRLYRARIPDPATDGAVMTKTLLADLAAPGGPVPLDNIEGLSYGPQLPDGRQSVVFVSDDNFNPKQVTQFLLFSMTR